MTTQLPKKIWFLWMQGENESPVIVKRCYESWCRLNPDWEVTFLDQSNLHLYLDLNPFLFRHRWDVSKQAYSDIIRINLLAKYGGVWVDSTCFCCRPLDEWIHEYMNAGFFAFTNPGADRLISSWFLASTRDCPLTLTYRREVNHYWMYNRFTGQFRKFNYYVLRRIFSKLFNRNVRSTRHWFSFWLVKVFKMYPYFWFHYMFARILKNKDCQKIWKAMKKYSADDPHKIMHHGFFVKPDEMLKQSIDNKEVPLYKLTWKFEQNQYTEDCAMDYLFKQ